MNKREKYLVQQQKRRDYIRTLLTQGLDSFDQKQIDQTVDAIFEFGENIIHTHKYNVWIAREIKKLPFVLHDASKIIDIVDWVDNERVDLFKFSFDQACDAQRLWHQDQHRNGQIVKKCPRDDERIVFRCNNGKHYFYLLIPKDLKYEGYAMGHCVGGSNYVNALSSKEIFIVSLRDENDEPHCTIEISRRTRMTVQIRGKSNADPVEKYRKMIIEFALHVSGNEDALDSDILKLIQ